MSKTKKSSLAIEIFIIDITIQKVAMLNSFGRAVSNETKKN